MKPTDILFKAKTTGSKEWVEGYLSSPDTINVIVEYQANESDQDTGYCEEFEIDPSTLCMWTTLTDKNGKKVFSGDVVRNVNKESEAYLETSQVEWHSTIGGFVVIFESIGQFKMLGVYDHLENLGSIHDNPELIEALNS